MRPQIELLEHHPKLRPHAIDVCACVRLTRAARSQTKSYRVPIDVNFAGRGFLDVIDASEQRALSRAAAPNHRENGTFAKINPAPAVLTAYTDANIQSGQTYTYVVTAIDANNTESDYSDPVLAVIP